VKTTGNYEILGEIGRGGGGVVWRARVLEDNPPHLPQGEIVALKMLNSDLRRPRATVLELDHDHIVRYLDVFSAEHGLEERWFIVMAFVDGESLEQRIARSPRGLSWPDANWILSQCIDACIYAHAKGITHRDLKPHNVMLCVPSDGDETAAGHVKLIDFDIARDEKKSAEGASSTMLAGTTDYMAPECVLQAGFKGDPISDIFSFGVLAYRTLCGVLPFPSVDEGGGIAELIKRWRSPRDTSGPSFRRGTFLALAPAAAEVIGKCLAPDRQKRYHSFEEVREAFKRITAKRIEGQAVYELTGYLGRGGLGAVYAGRRLPDLLPVAIKQPRMAGMGHREKDRFHREADILRQHPHEHIVRFIDYIDCEAGLDDSQTLIMERLEGAPEWCLNARIRQHRQGLPIDEVLPLFVHYTEALDHIHNQGFIHRDIKPGNLYAPPRNPDGARLFDMGIVRSLKGTQTVGAVPGTFDYMAPEMARRLGDRGTRATDVYALGLSLYEALTGRFPFERFDRDLLVACRQLIDRGAGKRDVVTQLDFKHACFRAYPELRRLILRALSFRPEKRFPTAEAMRNALLSVHVKPSHGAEREESETAAQTVATLADRGVTEATGLADAKDAATVGPDSADDGGIGARHNEALTLAEQVSIWHKRRWLWRMRRVRQIDDEEPTVARESDDFFDIVKPPSISPKAKAFLVLTSISSFLMLILLLGVLAWWLFRPPDMGFSIVDSPTDAPQELVIDGAAIPYRYFLVRKGVSVQQIDGEDTRDLSPFRSDSMADTAPVKLRRQTGWRRWLGEAWQSAKRVGRALVFREGDRYRIAAEWGSDVHLSLRSRLGAHGGQSLSMPHMPLRVQVGAIPTNQVYVPVVRVESPQGAQLVSEGIRSMLPPRLSDGRWDRECIVGWGDESRWYYYTQAGGADVGSPDVTDKPFFELRVPDLERLRDANQPQIYVWGNSLIEFNYDSNMWQRVVDDVRDFDPDDHATRIFRWREVSRAPLPRDWPIPANQTRSRLVVVDQRLSAPGWPHVTVVRDDAETGRDEIVMIGDSPIEGSTVLENHRWGDRLNYQVSRGSGEDRIEEDFTLRLVSLDDLRKEVLRLTELAEDADYGQWHAQAELWGTWMSDDLRAELAAIKRDASTRSPLVSRLTLVSRGTGPRWPAVRLRDPAPGEVVTVDDHIVQAGVPFTLDGHLWGDSLTYQIKRGDLRREERVLRLEPDSADIVLFCGLESDAGIDARRDAGQRWQPFLNEALYSQLVQGEVHRDPCAEFLEQLDFVGQTSSAYLENVNHQARRFRAVCQGQDHPQARAHQTNFWWRVFDDARTRGEMTIQRGALHQLVQLNVDPASFSTSMLGLPLATKPAGRYAVKGSSGTVMTFAFTVHTNRNSALDNLQAGDTTRIPMSAIFPHQVGVLIGYTNDEMGVNIEWDGLLCLVPDDQSRLTLDEAGTRTTYVNSNVFYILKTEIPVSALRLAGLWSTASDDFDDQRQWSQLADMHTLGTLRGQRDLMPFADASPRLAWEFMAWLNSRYELVQVDEDQVSATASPTIFRLPTGLEWQYVAQYRWTEDYWRRLFPQSTASCGWIGLLNEVEGRSARTSRWLHFNSINGLVDTGASRHGYTLGVQDMCGNAWELVEGESGSIRARGGSHYRTHALEVMPWVERDIGDARGARSEPLGFRPILDLRVHNFNSQ